MMPEGHDADALRGEILERYDMSLGMGLGKLAGRVFRIGHLGFFNDLTLCGTLCGVEMGLAVARGAAREERGGDGACVPAGKPGDSDATARAAARGLTVDARIETKARWTPFGAMAALGTLRRTAVAAIRRIGHEQIRQQGVWRWR